MKRTTLAAVALAALALLAGGALAAEYQSPTFPLSEEISVNNDTESLRVTVENITGTGVADLQIHGVDPEGNETLVTSSATLDTSGTDTSAASFEFSNVNETKYPSYNVTVSGEFGADYLEILRIDAVSGGGGFAGVPLTDTQMLAGGAVLAVLGVLFVASRDP